jgi:hypothetical protein
MATDLGRTILVALDDESPDDRSARAKFAAFVPIVVALLGVAVVLLGGISAGPTSVAEIDTADPIVTGSIPPAE